jgi:hypothetical protein
MTTEGRLTEMLFQSHVSPPSPTTQAKNRWAILNRPLTRSGLDSTVSERQIDNKPRSLPGRAIQ